MVINVCNGDIDMVVTRTLFTWICWKISDLDLQAVEADHLSVQDPTDKNPTIGGDVEHIVDIASSDIKGDLTVGTRVSITPYQLGDKCA